MLPAAFMPGDSRNLSPEAVEEGSGEGNDEVGDQLCPNCGQPVTAAEVSQSLFTELTE